MGIKLPAPNNAISQAKLEDFGNVEIETNPTGFETLIYIGQTWRPREIIGDYIEDATAFVMPNSVVRRNLSGNISANDLYCDELFIDSNEFSRIRQNNDKIEIRINGSTYPIIDRSINNTFTTSDGKTVTVSGAVITSIV